MGDPSRTIERPAFRHVDVQPVDQDGQSGVVISDPFGITADQVFVPDGLLPILGRFDGSKTVQEIEAELLGHIDHPLPPGMVSSLAEQMDGFLFLNSERFQRALESACQAFAKLQVRPSSHAGVSAGYPGTTAALRDALESMVHRPSGDAATKLRPAPRGLVAPHIDLARGREGYSMAYSALAECEPADLYVVFGTGHQGPGAPVTGLQADWQTPLGVLQTDRDFVAGIHRRLGESSPMDVFLHRREHSIEFQMLFLQHVLGDGRPVKVAGFLTGLLPHGSSRIEDEGYVQDLLGTFREQCDPIIAGGGRVCFVAGADLAHIGPKFDDPEPIDADRLARLTVDERARLEFLERADPSGFYTAVEGDGNKDRVCGTTPMFLTATLAGGPGRVLHYGQATAEDGSETVSYCAMVFEGDDDSAIGSHGD